MSHSGGSVDDGGEWGGWRQGNAWDSSIPSPKFAVNLKQFLKILKK